MISTGFSVVILSGRSVISPVIHVTVATSGGDILLGGVISGLTILLGVVATEMLVRVRERRRQLNEALWDLHSSAAGYLTGTGNATTAELALAYGTFAHSLGRLQSFAKWPIHNAKAIKAEVDVIYCRFAVAIAAFRAHQIQPRLGPVLGENLSNLVMRGKVGRLDSVNSALHAAGYPPVEQWDDDSAWATVESKSASPPSPSKG